MIPHTVVNVSAAVALDRFALGTATPDFVDLFNPAIRNVFYWLPLTIVRNCTTKFEYGQLGRGCALTFTKS